MKRHILSDIIKKKLGRKIEINVLAREFSSKILRIWGMALLVGYLLFRDEGLSLIPESTLKTLDLVAIAFVIQALGK